MKMLSLVGACNNNNINNINDNNNIIITFQLDFIYFCIILFIHYIKFKQATKCNVMEGKK